MQPTLIIDADDTLWETEIFYEQSIAGFGEIMAMHGHDREEAERTVDKVERERVPLVGYGPHAFAVNLSIAYERLCARYGKAVEREVSQAVHELGQLVVEPPMLLLDGVAEALPWLGERFQLILLTKGDEDVQTGKLARSGLESYFDGVHVVVEKDTEVFHHLIAQYGLEPGQTWVVGNSPRSDINPALAAGIGAVHIPHSCTWSFEQAEIADPGRVVVLGSFGELVALFGEQIAERGEENAGPVPS
jgi:putative hydrolase of the HAD superfamily